MNALERYRGIEFSLDDLVEAAAGLLRRLRVRAEDGRVSDLPDARTVRYYQTLGLIAKPVRYNGRNAVYSYRHLLQLLCVKRLQEEGHPLAMVQNALAGKTLTDLESSLATVASQTSPPGPSALPAPQALVASEVRPGILVIIDPRLVANPQSALERIAEALDNLTEKIA